MFGGIVMNLNKYLDVKPEVAEAIAAGKPVAGISKSGILEKLIKMKYDIPNDKPEMFDGYIAEIDSVISSLMAR